MKATLKTAGMAKIKLCHDKWYCGIARDKIQRANCLLAQLMSRDIVNGIKSNTLNPKGRLDRQQKLQHMVNAVL